MTAAGTGSAQATQVALTTPLGVIRVDLYEDKPATVANFLAYINDGRYANSFAHRLVPGFVLQSGGFTLQGNSVTSVPTFAPVVNEYGVGQTRSNVLGTIAMAKLGGDPNSATSQWFFNLANNSGNLDAQNGGFTVFGHVVAGLDVLALFNTTFNQSGTGGRGVYNASSLLGSAFDSMPLLQNSLAANNLIYTQWSVLSAPAYWTGTTDGQWNHSTNFATSLAGSNSFTGQVNATTDVVFNATGAANFANTQLGANRTVKTLTFNAPSAVGIGGSHTLAIASASPATGITVGTGTGPVTHTISSQVALGAAQTWAVADLGQTLVVSGTVTGNFALTKAGDGVLNLDGAQGYDSLTAADGTTNVNGMLGANPAAASASVTVAAGAKLKFGNVSQRLNSLTIGAGSTVTFTSGPASFTGTGADKVLGSGAVPTPEPSSALLLLSSAGMFLLRRRRSV